MKNKILKNREMRTKLKRMVDNMNEIILDGRLMVENPHEYIKEQLEFPDYYGNNLDALYDCLGEVYNKTIIIIIILFLLSATFFDPPVIDAVLIMR